MNPRPSVLIGLALCAMLVGGCRLLDPPPTPAPLIITATPEFIPPTPAPPTATFTPSPVLAPVALITRSPLPFPTATRTPPPTVPPTDTPTFTPTFTESPAPTLDVKACPAAPQGGFAAIYNRDPALQAAIGCALGPAVAVNAAVQDFEGGRMVWVSQLGDVPTGVIYALYNAGTYRRFNDTWREGVDPAEAPGGGGAPPGRVAPVRGFGKVWGTDPAVRNGLQWALGGEQGTGAQVQRFERGEMVFVGLLGQTYVLISGATGGTWRLEAVGF